MATAADGISGAGKKNWARSIAAVAAGYFTIFVSFVSLSLIAVFYPGFFTPRAESDFPWTLAGILAYTVVFLVLAGFVTALVANREPGKHVMTLGILQFIGSLAVAFLFRDMLPPWYAVLSVVFQIPAIWLGGRLKEVFWFNRRV